MDGGQLLTRSGSFEKLSEVLSVNDTTTVFYGLYLNEHLIRTPMEGMVLKPYSTWFKIDSADPRLYSCSPYETLDKFMSRNRLEDCVVMHSDEIVPQIDCRMEEISTYKAFTGNPLWIKPYSTWFKIDSDDPEEISCSPYETLDNFLSRNRLEDCVVMHSDEIVPQFRCRKKEISTYKASTGNPLWIRTRIQIPINDRLYEIRPTLPIGQYVRDTFGSTYFAFMPPIRILQENATCISEGFNESRGFSVKSRMVTIQILSDRRDVDMTGCNTIQDVADKVNGQEVIYNGITLDKAVSLDEVIMKEKGKCIFTIRLSPQSVVFAMETSVSAAASNTNNDSIMNKTMCYKVYSHYLALTLYEAWSGAKKQVKIQKIIDNFRNILSDTHPQGGIYVDHEKTYTAFLSGELGHFLDTHLCLHQPSLSHKTRGVSVPDFCICRDSVVTTPIVVADFKKSDDDFIKATSQSFGYAQDVLTYSNSNNPIVAIPGTSKRFALYLCFKSRTSQFKPKLITIKIGEALVTDNLEMTGFLAALKCAVEEIASYQ